MVLLETNSKKKKFERYYSNNSTIYILQYESIEQGKP